MMTEAQFWASKRNWLLKRLRGAASIFTGITSSFISSHLSTHIARVRLYRIQEDLKALIDDVSSVDTYKKYMGKGGDTID